MRSTARERTRLPLNALRAFEVAARYESFVAAAEELNVTPAAISRHIRVLEEMLDEKLFIRYPQSIELTEFGRLWLPSLADTFNIVDSSVHRVIKSISHEPITVTCQTAYATGWLMPRLHNFYESHPDIELRLYTSNEIDERQDISRQDCTILGGRGAWPDVKSHFLITNRFIPVCSPDYLERTQTNARPSDLLSETLIVSETNETFWRDWFAQHVMPLTAADHAWSTHHLYSPESHLFLDSWLCVSAREIWVEWNRKSWREEEPPERHATNRIGLREVMPVDFLSTSNKVLSPVISRVAITPYADRLRALQEAERIHEMMSTAAYAMQREVPGEILSVVDRLWLGKNVASKPRATRSAMSKQNWSDGIPSSKQNDQRLPGPSLESCLETS